MEQNPSLGLALYALYIVISAVFTVWVGRTLHKNGRIFLVDVFAREELADSVNQLLIVGFYLVNAGFVVTNLRVYGYPESSVQLVEVLSSKIGVVILTLGGMHFFNLFVFSRMRKRASAPAPAPVAPPQPVAYRPM